MSKKVFISYSHKDESFRQELETHLSLLKRSGVISSWSDRKILPGQEWKDQIHKNLHTSEIIIFLISSDFIASDYCMDIELAHAIHMHDTGTAKLLPIIIRSSDWSTSVLGRIQALPEEAKPITKWNDRDEAWLNVVTGIRLAIKDIDESKKNVTPPQEPSIKTGIDQKHLDWLSDTEIQLTHRRVAKVKLTDIYVTPDLKKITSGSQKIYKTVNASSIKGENIKAVIYGNEQSGKTSLTKHLFIEYFKSGYTPITIKGSEINKADINDIAQKKQIEQYEKEEDLSKIQKQNKVIIIDDFAQIKLNRKFTEQLIRNITENFSTCIFIAEESYQYITPDIDALSDFEPYLILGFGNVRRQELIEKWVALGVEQEISEETLYKETDEIKVRLDSLVRRNVIPAKPIFLLSLLQMLEAYTPQKLDLTSYGHCYQYLVYQSLEKSNIKPAEIDKYLNVLTELAWEQYKNSGNALNEEQVNDFFSSYEQKYLKVDKDKILSDLTINRILSRTDEKTHFKYPYIYYFFTAKKFADSFTQSDMIKKEISLLLESIHREDFANIIIFITHHTKEKWILDEIQMSLMELFDSHSEATLEQKTLEFMEHFIKEIPELVIEQRVVAKERLSHNKKLDEISSNEQEIQEFSNKLEPTNLLAKVNRVFKGLEIIGQIVRNRHASLSRDSIYEIVDQAYTTGLRFLQFFLELSDIAKEEVTRLIANTLKENPTISIDDLEKEAKNTFISLTYASIYGIINKISSSTGSKEAEEIYKLIETNRKTPAVKLINQATTLQFQKRIDFNEIEKLSIQLKGNPICERILKEIVIQHIYMFPVDYKDKQRIASTLRIKLENLKHLETQKTLKI
jgi:hypothetical protein